MSDLRSTCRAIRPSLDLRPRQAIWTRLYETPASKPGSELNELSSRSTLLTADDALEPVLQRMVSSCPSRRRHPVAAGEGVEARQGGTGTPGRWPPPTAAARCSASRRVEATTALPSCSSALCSSTTRGGGQPRLPHCQHDWIGKAR